jgi:hypothetical protein
VVLVESVGVETVRPALVMSTRSAVIHAPLEALSLVPVTRSLKVWVPL